MPATGQLKCRRVKAVIHQALGNIFGGDALERAQVQDAFVCDEAVAAVERGEMIFQSLGNVVGVENGVLGRFGESVRASHGNIHPGNRQDAGAAPWRRGHGANCRFESPLFQFRRNDSVARQELDQMFRHANRANAGSAATVRNAEGFVQVQMADVCADVARAGEANLGVHVRAVHIDLSAVRVNDFANLTDGFLKYAVRAGIGDHEAGEVVFVRFGFGLQVGARRCCLIRHMRRIRRFMPAMTALAGLVP